MMICPKVETCKLEKHQPCFAPNHSIPHAEEGSCDSCSAYCPACIPVPSTPASVSLSPDELLKWEFIAKSYYKNCADCCKEKLSPYTDELGKQPDIMCGRFGINEICPYQEYKAKEVITKCHQSEAARIKELEQFQFELNHKLHETELTIGQIRADQNKKIGEDLTKILLDDTIKNSISRCRTITDYVADNLIAKLQKGEL
jgi:hypothetical protein